MSSEGFRFTPNPHALEAERKRKEAFELEGLVLNERGTLLNIQSLLLDREEALVKQREELGFAEAQQRWRQLLDISTRKKEDDSKRQFLKLAQIDLRLAEANRHLQEIAEQSQEGKTFREGGRNRQEINQGIK